MHIISCQTVSNVDAHTTDHVYCSKSVYLLESPLTPLTTDPKAIEAGIPNTGIETRERSINGQRELEDWGKHHTEAK